MNRSKATRSEQTNAARPYYAEHSRRWEDFAYVYPVISRRSRGLSVGINLNPDTICNFDCVYCQVDKTEHPRPRTVDLTQLESELTALLQAVALGEVWRHPVFINIDPSLKRLNDIAFSGDGEPTASAVFPQAVQVVTRLKQSLGLNDTKIVLITNATLLNRERVELAVQQIDAHRGEVWAKLDAGTVAYYKRVDRSSVPYQTILNNILACGRRRPIVIQSMFAQLHDQPPGEDEFDAYTQRITELIARGCRIKAIQLYTVARQTQELYVTALSDETLETMAIALRTAAPHTEVQWFGARG